MGVTFMDPNSFSYNIHMKVVPFGVYVSDDGLQRLARPVQLFINGKLFPLTVGQPISTLDSTITFTEGDSNKYPFETYMDVLEAYAVAGNSSNITDIVPIGFFMATNLQGCVIEPNITEIPGYNRCVTYFSRSRSAKFFSIFVCILMWILSLSALIVAVTLWIRKRKVEPPLIGLSAALLFALPALRSIQPGVPVVGINLDTVGFFWNMALIAISVILLLWNYIIMYQKPLKAKSSESTSAF